MEAIIPWKALSEAIELYYPNPQGTGRKLKGLEKMRRIPLPQHGFALSDPGVEASLYDFCTRRHFVGIDLGNEPVPDNITIGNFRHRMETNNLGDQLFRRVNADLAENGVKVHLGVDSKTKWIHSVAVTPTNVHDGQVMEDLLHGNETRVGGDTAYTGQKETLNTHAPEAKTLPRKRTVVIVS